jgi:integrase
VLSNVMRDWCDAAGLQECSAHGLRKAIVRRLLQAGATEYQVAAITGHSDLDEIRTYAQDLDNQRLGAAAMGLLGGVGQSPQSRFPQTVSPNLGISRKT